MISDELKKQIQSAYSTYLESRELKPRSGQKQMIAAVSRTLAATGGGMLAVEAGTGTGKTVAYMIPAISVAQKLGKKLVVSTATVALQEQLVSKDLPEILDCTDLGFQYALVKGRGRYLCQLKLENMLGGSSDDASPTIPMYEEIGGALEKEALELYRELDLASTQKLWDGDREHWKSAIPDKYWWPLTSDRYQCVGRGCHAIRNCAFFNSREEIEDADVLITNHDIVMADLRLGGGAILPPPEECIYVFDEGHHLADKARQHFANSYRLRTSLQLVDTQITALSEMERDIGSVDGVANLLRQLGASLADVSPKITACRHWLIGSELASTSSQDRFRFSNGEIPEELKSFAIELASSYRSISMQLESLCETVSRQIDQSDPNSRGLERWYPDLGQWFLRAESARKLWVDYESAATSNGTTSKDGEDDSELYTSCRWLEFYDNGGDSDFHSAPILADEVLRQHLWQRCHGAIVTSATLTALGSFDRFSMHSGFPPESDRISIPSPFNYPEFATLNLPNRNCDPRDADTHDEIMIETLPRILKQKQGSLVLFSSARQMNAVYEQIDSDWREMILRQGDHAKQVMIDLHKQRVSEGETSILFGLASFAEGIDLPGDFCTHVVIAKIPFAVPDQPIEAALAEWVEQQGGNSFAQVSLPDASMRLIQAVGRLLRSETDSGEITIFDQRLLASGYGRRLVSALPPCRQQLFELDQLH